MVRGNSAIKYSIEIDQPSVEFLLSPVGAALPVDSLVLKPDAQGEIVVKIGDFRATAPSIRAGERLDVFDHLYGLFQNPPPLDQRVGIYKCAELTPVSPGEECPPALFMKVPDFD